MIVNRIRVLFIASAIYDGLFGLVFLLFGTMAFRWVDVPPPNHIGYIQFPALILILFAAMFVQVARDPVRNRSLIPYGAGLKAAYAGVVFWNELDTGIPGFWLPWAWVDLCFLVLFLLSWSRLRPRTRDSWIRV